MGSCKVVQDSAKLLKRLFAVTPFVISKETGQDVMKGPCLPVSGLVKACAGGRCRDLRFTGDGRVPMPARGWLC